MTPITASAVEYICLNMRAMDRAEVYGIRGHDNPYILSREVILAATYGKAAIAEYRGRPSAIIGVSPLWPGVWSAWCFGTDDWRRSALELTRYARTVLRPFVIERAHRLQCESRIDHTDAHRWLTALGAKPDGMMAGYGRDGSTYILFSWSREDVPHQSSRAEGRAPAA